MPHEAAAREALEETGLAVTVGELMRIRRTSNPHKPGFLLTYHGEVTGGHLQAADDVSEARWFAAADIPWDELAFETTRVSRCLAKHAMNQIDLHTHTTTSDGRHTPTELVQMAADLGLRAIAVCDHDTTAGLDEAQATATAQGIELIPAVELSCDVAEGELHMLGYFPRYHDEAFQAEMARLREGRWAGHRPW